MPRTSTLLLALLLSLAGCDGGGTPDPVPGTDSGLPPTVDAGSDPGGRTFDPDELSLDGFTIAQREFAESGTMYFDRTVEDVRTACGWAPDSAIVWKSFLPEIDLQLSGGGGGRSLHGYCGAPLEQIASYCRNERTAAVDAVMARITTYRCFYGVESGWYMGIHGDRLEHDADLMTATSEVGVWMDNNL